MTSGLTSTGTQHHVGKTAVFTCTGDDYSTYFALEKDADGSSATWTSWSQSPTFQVYETDSDGFNVGITNAYNGRKFRCKSRNGPPGGPTYEMSGYTTIYIAGEPLCLSISLNLRLFIKKFCENLTSLLI